MLATGDATGACLEVSLRVSRAAGVESALPVHASLRWMGRGRQNRKKVERLVTSSERSRAPGGMTRSGYEARGNSGVTLALVGRPLSIAVPSLGRHHSGTGTYTAGTQQDPWSRSHRDDMPGGDRSGLPKGPCEPWIFKLHGSDLSRFPIQFSPSAAVLSDNTALDNFCWERGRWLG
jgi:hypothetical protein